MQRTLVNTTPVVQPFQTLLETNGDGLDIEWPSMSSLVDLASRVATLPPEETKAMANVTSSQEAGRVCDRSLYSEGQVALQGAKPLPR
ncbi:hypothetical protein RRG08_043393 [Elysia crispata]|uniref:Uncharacterized protein n=1 Tax=Elysia crispata TaxID=231223 RepID=A0AAE1ATI4_9GAST|nr:hypothetical protein RRG08_043393 [Elysia crispata]